MLNLIIFLIVVVGTIVLGQRKKINIGIIGMAFAFIFGFVLLQMNASKIIAKFPVSLFFNMFIAACFFGFAIENGTMKGVAMRLMYAFRNAKWATGIALFITSYIVAAIGGGVAATPFIMSPIAFSLATQMGFSPVIAVIAVWAGGGAGSYVPWGSTPIMFAGSLSQVFSEPEIQKWHWGLLIWGTILLLIVFLLVFFYYKGYKVSGEAKIEKPEPFTKIQKLSLTIIAVAVLLVILPALIQLIAPNPVTKWLSNYIKIQTVFAIGTVINALCKTGDLIGILKNRVPWGGIILVCGMSMMMTLCNELGIVTTLSQYLDGIPAWLVMPALVLFVAFLSFFVSGTALLAAFVPILPVIVSLTGGQSLPVMLTFIYALNASSASPFSQGGATALCGCYDEKDRETCTNAQIKIAIISTIIAVLWAASGLARIGA
ncbi:MAG: hypothetical protein K6A91_04125 [Clostridia bacterium]|nr:hypothetical protein [Clostridia bacterium]